MISSTPCHDNHTDSDTVPVQIILMKKGEAIGHFSRHILQISDVTLCWLVGVAQWVECYRACCWIYGQGGSYSAHFMCKICKVQQLKTIKKTQLTTNMQQIKKTTTIKQTLWHCENVTTTNKQQILKFDFCRSLLINMSGHYSINMELELGY